MSLTASVIALAVAHSFESWRSIHDHRAPEAMRALAETGIVSGESGASGLGALLELTDESQSAELRQRLGIGRSARVLVISTERATDPIADEQVLGRPPSAVCGDH